MKKLMSLFMTVVLCFSLVACGGPDMQPAIDAFNSASEVVDRLGNTLNANADAYQQELFDTVNEKANEMLDYKAVLESGEAVTEEQIAEMMKVFAQVEAWALETEANLDEWEIKVGDKQAVIDTFNKTSTVFDELVNEINANIEAQDQNTIDLMNQMADTLLQTKDLLESDKQLTEDEVNTLIQQLSDIEKWVGDAKEVLVGGTSASNEAAGEDVVYADKQSIIEYFNMVSPMFDATATAVNENIDAYSEEFVDTLISLSGLMTSYKEILESDYEITQEDYDAMMVDLTAIEQWLLEIESDVFG